MLTIVKDGKVIGQIIATVETIVIDRQRVQGVQIQ